MKDAENYLKEHWYATRHIGRLMLDLTLARHAYEQSYEGLSISAVYEETYTPTRRKASPVERSAMLVVDHHRAEVESIERRLQKARHRAAEVEKTVTCAGLTPRELDYVRMRYFENKRVESVARDLYCSTATCRRIRKAALQKVAAHLRG